MPRDVNGYSTNTFGFKQESLVTLRETEGLFGFFVNVGYCARITVKNENAPELPNLEFSEFINWTYMSTEISIQRDKVSYDFEIKDFNDEELRQVVFFFDTLYGF